MDSKNDRGAGSSSRPESRGPLSQVKKRASTPKPENDFLCQPRYSFTPPEAEMDLKLIDFEPDLSFYAPLETSALDLKHQRPILTDPTHGVRVNLVDLDEYREYQEGEGPDPEDLILLDPESDANEKSFRRKTSGSAPFLRAMFYDEYKIDKIDYSGAASKRQREVKKKTRDELLRDVLAEFQACKKKPVHPNSRKKHLKPVEITPFLPDFENYFIKYVLVHFEDDPKENVRPALERNLNRKEAMGAEDLREMVNTAVTLGRRGEDNEAVLSFYTPVDDEIEKRRKQRQTPDNTNLPDKFGTANSEDYHLVKEYVFDVRGRDHTADIQRLYMVSSKAEFSSYSEVSGRMTLHKRPLKGDASIQNRRLILKRRRPNEDDQAERVETIMQMCIGDEAAEMANALEE